jgi:uncharacterized repeat protein (TIGR04052 family)
MLEFRVLISALSLRLLLPLIAVLITLSACVEPSFPVTIDYAIRYGGKPISCTQPVDGVVLTDLRFFVHGVTLTTLSGEPTSVDLIVDGTWQGEQVALLDFEDGQGACVNGSKQVNSSIRGVVAQQGPFRGIRFTLGIATDQNHRDPITATAPLDYTAMHWHWLSGYKFMRVGLATANNSDGVWMHLGSSRCDGSIGEGIHCSSPNRVEVLIDDFVPENQRIVLDLQRLFADADLADGAPSNCSSGPAETSCVGPFRALGLPAGENANTSRQSVFRSELKR